MYSIISDSWSIVSYRNRLEEAHVFLYGFDLFRINGTDEVIKLPMKYRTYENNTKENQQILLKWHLMDNFER